MTASLSTKEFALLCSYKNKFLAEILEFELIQPQKQLTDAMLYSVLHNEGMTLAGCFSRQTGKTTCSVGTIGFIMTHLQAIKKKFNLQLPNEFNVGFFAPQQEQAKTPFLKLKDFFLSLGKKSFGGRKWEIIFDEFSQEKISFRTGDFHFNAYHFTASPTSHPESKTLHFIYYDEAQDLIDKQIDKAIAPMGAMTNATELWTGVGGYRRCRFFDHLDRLSEEQKVIMNDVIALQEFSKLYKTTNNPVYLNYQKHLEKKGREIGKESDEYKTQYLVQWILERGQFITYEELMKLEKEYDILNEYPRVQVCYGGLDWGKVHDPTVLTIIDGLCRVVGWYEWAGDDYNTQYEEICHLIRTKYQGMRQLHCDATATQDQAVDVLRARLAGHGVSVVPVVFGSKTKDQMFKNLSMLMKPTLLHGDIVEEAKFAFHTANSLQKERFIREMLDLQKEIRNGLWRCQHPAGPNYHDDYCDSVALAALAFKREISRGKRVTGMYAFG